MSTATEKQAELPKGLTCECGIVNEFPPYVYAHWSDELNFTCKCGRHFQIYAGRAEEL